MNTVDISISKHTYSPFVRHVKPIERDAVVFIVFTSGIGGVTTLVARRADWLRRNGIHSEVISIPGAMQDAYFDAANRVTLLDPFQSDFQSQKISEHEAICGFLADKLRKFNSVYFETYSHDSMYMASSIMRHLPNSCGGLYLIQDRTLTSIPCIMMHPLVECGIIYGMNSESFAFTERENGIKFRRNVIFPIPYSVPSETFTRKITNKKNILTIARFDIMKGYIVGLLEAMPKVLSNHPDVELTIVGDGPLRHRFEGMVRRLGLQKNVVFTGMLPISRLEALIDESFAYVGMGTTVLMAASRRVPCILAQPWTENAVGAGYFGSQKGYEFGEMAPSTETHECWLKVIHLFDDLELYNKIADDGFNKLKNEFNEDIVMKRQKNYFDNQFLTFSNVLSPIDNINNSEIHRFIKRSIRDRPELMNSFKKYKSYWKFNQ